MAEMAVLLIDAILLLLVVLTAVAVVEVRDLFSATILLGVYSLLMALIWLNMDAVDVSFTEAAVGAGISTILLIGTIIRVGCLAIARQISLHVTKLAMNEASSRRLL